ncbi:hypothetical protein Ccrd_003595 [Cynara cardunculus var. scolymus]|uniref:Myc-type, basic helix-loop-helix (BHLH) domain-containing protein n=1 Tax=Cynara cardunculus var. scolymus TaxID=59895 RepID=A0A103XP56_CYNCS|nr:hypothetical protein Ccrd_003595 [Cynara cardunculus var. scolymus]
MANSNPSDGSADDFFEQILGFPAYPAGATDPNLAGNEGSLGGSAAAANSMILQLSSAGDGSGHHHLASGIVGGGGGGGGGGGFHFPLGLSLEHGKGGFLKMDDASGSGKRFRDDVVDSRVSSSGQPMPNTVQTTPNPPTVRPTRTDRAAMLDEIVDYVKFLRLQVKEEAGEGGRNQPAWEKWSNDGTERQVAKLMEENVGAAMQFLQSKALCIMPISLASAIYHTQPPDSTSIVKPESEPPL